MAITMMTDLMAAPHNLLYCFWISVCGMPGDEPGGLNAKLVQQVQNALGADHPKFAARDHAGRAGLKRTQPERDRVEIKSQADSLWFIYTHRTSVYKTNQLN